jgi:hypothetical protein
VGGLLATLAVVSIADSEDVADISFIALIFGAVWVAGLGVRRQRDLAGRLADHAALLEREQEARALAAAAEERARIARELHDVVAQSVSTMVVQAEAGEALLDRDPERAADRRRANGRGRRCVAGSLARPSARRGLRPSPAAGRGRAGGAPGSDRARDRGAPSGGARAIQRGDRRRAQCLRGHRPDAREPHPPEARRARPCAGGRARLRIGPGAAGPTSRESAGPGSARRLRTAVASPRGSGRSGG